MVYIINIEHQNINYIRIHFMIERLLGMEEDSIGYLELSTNLVLILLKLFILSNYLLFMVFLRNVASRRFIHYHAACKSFH